MATREYIIIAANGGHYRRVARSARDAERGFWNEYRVKVVAVFADGDPLYLDYLRQQGMLKDA